VFLRGTPTPEPFAVVAEHRVVACDAKAAARGVHPGMEQATALALVAQLRLKDRDRAAETEALLGVAAWAGHLTPAVVPDFPATVLMEVSASLRLWGGLPAILERLKAGMEELGFTCSLACAPTSRAAAWFALQGKTTPQPPGDGFEAAVAALPLQVLESARERMDVFEAIGAASIGDVLALPRPGVARRFGQALLDEIDRGLGKLADPRSLFTPPERFHAEVEFPSEVTQAEALLFAGQRLLAQLAGFLAARSAGVQRISVKLFHRDSHTEATIGLVAPSRDARHFTLLLRERLGKAPLPAPVRALAVSADNLQPAPGVPASLFPDQAAEAGNWMKLVEQLRARLGEQAVQGLAVQADHRPELATAAAPDGHAQMRLALPPPLGSRPFWLLPKPRPLDAVEEARGDDRLQLLAGPERIESGWWDGADIARDYFIARSTGQSLLWIYRERPRGDAPQHWYVHGVFA